MAPTAPAAWVFEVDPGELDLVAAFAEGEAVLEFEVGEEHTDALRPGQIAHLWVRDRRQGRVPAGLYATGSIVGPVTWIGAGDDRYPVVEAGFEALVDPIDGVALLSGDEFVGSPLQSTHVTNPVPLDRAQAEAVAADPLETGALAPVLALAGADEDEGIVLPALEVRLPADTLLVVEGVDHDGWTVVRGTPDMDQVEELPERHRTFMDAVEYVAAVADQVATDLPVIDPEDDLEAIAIFDAEGGMYVVVKEAPGNYAFCWLEDDGTLERVDEYASLREALLLPVLDEQLFGGH